MVDKQHKQRKTTLESSVSIIVEVQKILVPKSFQLKMFSPQKKLTKKWFRTKQILV